MLHVAMLCCILLCGVCGSCFVLLWCDALRGFVVLCYSDVL